MSAYIVGHDHINALLSFALDKRVSYFDPAQDCRVDITAKNVNEVGAILLTENERSVSHRYSDCKPGELPGTIGENAAGYRFRRFGPHDVVVVLKACNCFDYQACETDDYEDSLAWKIIDAIRHHAIRALPGYENADGWDITRKAVRK